MKNKSKKIIGLTCIIIVLLTVITVYLKFFRVNTDLEYCKEIGRKINLTKTEQFYCSHISKRVDDEPVIFYFNLVNRGKFDEKECIRDIAKIRKTMVEYLKNEPTNELNDERITVIFQTLPGDTVQMSNHKGREEGISNDFPYFMYLFADLSDAQDFKDARSIDLKINSSDELDLLKDWKNLQYLYICGTELTDEDQQYLISILPNCTIVYKGNKINGT